MKVGIVGAGNVGATIAYTLSLGEQVSEIMLVDKNVEKAHGEILDLRHGLPFIPYVNLEYGGTESLSDMDTIIVTAGIPRKPGETRLDLARKNTDLFKDIIPEITKSNPHAVYLIVSNPVDVVTYAAIKYSGIKDGRVFGSGNVLDSARFRSMLGYHFKIDPSNIHAYILGEHGDSSFPVYSQSFAGCTPLKNMPEWDEQEADKIFHNARNVAAEVIKKKGATYYAVSLGVVKIIKAIYLNKKRVLPATTLLSDYQGETDVCLSMPSVIGKRGVERILEIPFDETEKQKFHNSAEKIKNVLDELKLRE